MGSPRSHCYGEFTFGVKALDSLIGFSLMPGSTILLTGHPGSGKTILALSMCYANALRGHPCLYIGFYEDKAKLYTLASRLGMDIGDLESKGLLLFVKFPVTMSVGDVLDNINSIIKERNFKVVVVDSVTVLLEGARERERAYALNYFYNLSNIIEGFIILVAETPYDYKILMPGGLEFVADIVLMLKYRVERGLIDRFLEIRKARGSPVSIVEIPFTIVEGAGLRLWPPPLLGEVVEDPEETIVVPCSRLAKVLSPGTGKLRRSETILIAYPPDARHIYVAAIPAMIILANRMKALAVSYKYSEGVARALLSESVKLILGEDPNVEALVDRHFTIRSVNPFGMSLNQLSALELKMLEEGFNANIFHGVDVPMLSFALRDYVPTLYNQRTYIKGRGILNFRMFSVVDERLYRVNSTLSDAVLRLRLKEGNGGELSYELYAWRRGFKPQILSEEDLIACIKEASALIKARVKT
ncbi:MAG: gas vesicle protein GvpD [Thermoprotei archaeon]|nr:gas vesicle protein GvpD [Thermoprotei archaeon]